MLPKISKAPQICETVTTACFIRDFADFSFPGVSENERQYVAGKPEKETGCLVFKYPGFIFLYKHNSQAEPYIQAEAARKAGAKMAGIIKSEKTTEIQIDGSRFPDLVIPFLEGLLLAGYSFSKYKKEKEESLLQKINIVCDNVSEAEIAETVGIIDAVGQVRNLVNEPVSFLNAARLAEEIARLGDESGFETEILHREKIESLKMGGLLAVNRGSKDHPTFTIMEWKPGNAKNKQPVVLVGKGVVFDTGGLSLKPTPKSMDFMKSDMAGAAVVAGTISALAKNKIPLHVIGLVPATDNRPSGNAYTPGDIITMSDGTTVEIRNTDAEGRLILADTLCYAKKYDPLLVIDLATLTGAAEIISGSHAAVVMGNSPEYLQKLTTSGFETYERLVEVPLWEEYALPLQSSVADLNNLGVREGQSIIAGKFLEHFASGPWIHLDIAGTAFLHEKDHYKPAGGTGFGTRLLYNFLKKFN